MKLNCLIIDDEPVARKGIAEYVNEVDFLNLVAQCENPLKASTYLSAHSIDLLFLDIQMPKLSGIDFLKTLTNPPLVIFTTAFLEYALEGYALDVVDYLVKPITFERFLKAVQKAREIHHLKQLATTQPGNVDYFFIKCNGKYEKIQYNDVRYIEALQNYIVLYTTDRKLISYMTLSSIEHQLPQHQFLKVHKSYIVNVGHIKAIEGNDIFISETRIPISRNLKEDVINRILGNRLFKR